MNGGDPIPDGWTSGTREANGLDLHFLRTGGAKPPVVALHGLAASGACWTPVARELQDEFDVVMPDARGHGRSGAPARGYGYPDHADDVVGLVEGLGLAAPVLLGHSMGGLTAALAAARPGPAVRGVVLADPTFLSPERQREVYASGVIEQHRRLLAADPDESRADARRRHPRRPAALSDLLVEARLRTRPEAFEVLAPPNPDFRGLVRAIRAPVLLVIGGDGVVSPDTARELAALHPRLAWELVPDVGHGLPHDAPERLAALVRAFARSLGGAR